MRNQSSSKPEKKPALRLVTAPKVRLAGTAATDDMAPGKYMMQCDTAWITSKGKSSSNCIIQFTVLDGKYHGTALRMWLPVSDGGGIVSPTSRYAQYCSLALGWELTEDDSIDDPAQIFEGRTFIGVVGYRKSERPGGGGKTSDDLALRKKDDKDYLKVHELLERVDL